MASSSESDRSIAGISLPQWMKNRINDRYDLDQSTFSPPTEDDSFFYIRYPKTEAKPLESEGDPSYRPISDILQNHTLPCQEFLPSAKASPRELNMKRGLVDPPFGVVKSTGTDDGFHSAAAACGQSVVAVAHQMIANGKLLSRQHPAPPSTSSHESDEESAPPPPHMRTRRSSRSLPVSPQPSPPLLRKNPFFTDGLLGSSDKMAVGVGELAKENWFLDYVRDTQETLRTSMSDLKILEEPGSSLTQPTIVKPKHKVAKPRPSQLREMNFWSPTSM